MPTEPAPPAAPPRDPGAPGLAAPAVRLLAPLGLAIAAAAAFGDLTRLPLDDTNALRITPAVALAHGWSMYALPGGGPISEYLYPPLSAFWFLPAALARSPSGILAAGGVLTLLAFALPAAWLHARAGRSPWRMAAGAAFALVVLDHLGLRFTATNIHVEAPAAGLAALAIGLLLPPGGAAPRRTASAACAVLAVWTKQTTVPLLAILPLYLLARDGIAAARRWAAAAVVAGTAVSLAMVAAFGWRELAFTLFTVPGGHRFYGEDAGGGKLDAIAVSAGLLWAGLRLPAAILVALAAVTAREAPGWRAWLRANRWVALAVVGTAMIPVAVLGAAKYLAFVSAHTPSAYFVAAAATTGLAEVASRPGRGRAAAAWALVALLAWTGVRVGGRLAAEAPAIAARTRGFAQNAHEDALAFARAHPGAVWFPRNPLVTLLADGRLDHSEWGILDWDWAGHPPPPAQLRAHLPPRLRWMAFRDTDAGPLSKVPPPTARLPEFDRPVAEPALPGWRVYERRGDR